MKIQLNAAFRLQSAMELDAAGFEDWSKERQEQYLKKHPGSKYAKGYKPGAPKDKAPAKLAKEPAKPSKGTTPPPKQQLHHVPKLSELYQYSDEFTPEQNRVAEQEARKEIQRVKSANEKISEQNKKTQSERTKFTKETLKTHSPKDIGSALKGQPKLMDNILKTATQWDRFKKLKPEQKKATLVNELTKSPGYRKNFISDVLSQLRVERSIPKEERQQMYDQMLAVFKTGKPEAIKEMVENMF